MQIQQRDFCNVTAVPYSVGKSSYTSRKLESHGSLGNVQVLQKKIPEPELLQLGSLSYKRLEKIVDPFHWPTLIWKDFNVLGASD